MTIAEVRNFARANRLKGHTRHRRRDDLITFLRDNYQPAPNAALRLAQGIIHLRLQLGDWFSQSRCIQPYPRHHPPCYPDANKRHLQLLLLNLSRKESNRSVSQDVAYQRYLHELKSD